MIKLSIAVLLSVEVEPFVCFHELNLSEIFLVLLVPYFDLYYSAMPEFCRICTRLKIKKDQKKKHVSSSSTKDADGNISI